MPASANPYRTIRPLGHVTGQAPYIDDLPLRSASCTSASSAARSRRAMLSVDRARRRPRFPASSGVTPRRRPGPQHVRRGRSGRAVPGRRRGACIWANRSRSWRPNRATHSRRPQGGRDRVPRGRADLGPRANRSSREKFLGRAANRPRRCRRGNSAAAPHRLSGTFHSGGQEQFYLESQAAIAYPGEQGQMVVHSSTQNPTEIQAVVAEMLGVGQHEVVCICKRMGGAFGGKESQAAHSGDDGRARRPQDGPLGTRRSTTKTTTCASPASGTRTAANGKSASATMAAFTACASRSTRTAACSTDLSLAVMERTLLHTDNCYFLPQRRAHRPGVLHEPAVEHGVPRLRRAAGDGGHREHSGDRSPSTLGLDAFDVRHAQPVRRRRAQHHAVRPDRSTRTTCRKSSRRSPPARSIASGATKSPASTRRRERTLRGLAMTRREVRHLVHDASFSTRATRWSTSTPTARCKFRPAPPRWARAST